MSGSRLLRCGRVGFGIGGECGCRCEGFDVLSYFDESTGVLIARSHLALATILRHTEIHSLDADFRMIVPSTTVVAAPIRARVSDSSHA
jgi:hypothetical protein